MTKKSLRRQASGAAIGARLRRLSERIDREANAVYAARGIDFEASYSLPLSRLSDSMDGNLGLRFLATHFIDYVVNTGITESTEELLCAPYNLQCR